MPSAQAAEIAAVAVSIVDLLMARLSPTWPTTPKSGESDGTESALKVASDPTKQLRHLAGRLALRVATVAVTLAQTVEQVHQVLNNDDHLFGAFAQGVRLRFGDRRGGIEYPNLQCLIAAATGRRASDRT